MNSKYIIKTIISLVIICLTVSCTSKNTKRTDLNIKAEGEAIITFRETLHDFNKIESGEEISFSFKFENTGTKNLIIDSVKTDCGCLIVGYPEEAIKPGDNNYIDVLFNSRGEVGRIIKQIIVYSNGNKNPINLNIVAEANNKLFNF